MGFKTPDGQDLTSRGTFLDRVTQEQTVQPTRATVMAGCCVAGTALVLAYNLQQWGLAIVITGLFAATVLLVLLSGLLLPVKPRRVVWRALRGDVTAVTASTIDGWHHPVLVAKAAPAPRIEPLAFTAGRTVEVALQYPSCTIVLSEVQADPTGHVRYEEFAAYAEARARGSSHAAALAGTRADAVRAPLDLRLDGEQTQTEVVTVGSEWQLVVGSGGWEARVMGTGRVPEFRLATP
jgi:hypothetical protein